MKKAYPKILITFYLIPWALTLLFTGIDCLFHIMYEDWLWLKDFMMLVPVIFADIFEQFAVYSSFGVIAYYIFFEKLSCATTANGVALVASFVIPFSRYFVRHFSYKNIYQDIDMLGYFYEDFSVAIASLIYAVIMLVIVVLVKVLWKQILKKEPQNRGLALSVRHPIGFTMALYFGAMVLVSVIIFLVDGVWKAETFLSLGGEMIVNLFGYVVSVIAAVCCARRMTAVKKAI